MKTRSRVLLQNEGQDEEIHTTNVARESKNPNLKENITKLPISKDETPQSNSRKKRQLYLTMYRFLIEIKHV